MSVYLQFDSKARSDPFIQGAGGNWFPNDNNQNSSGTPYQISSNLVQSPTNYRVFWGEINSPNKLKTIGFRAHCKDTPGILNFTVENCMVTVPASALIKRTNDAGVVTYVNVLNEPYLYVRLMTAQHAEGDLIYSNNNPASDATFIVWHDKTQVANDDTISPAPPYPAPHPNNTNITLASLDAPRWVVYKTCMNTVMRLNMESDEWQVRIYDRYGNDVVISESDNGGVGFTTPPSVDPDLQTSILVGITPNYPVSPNISVTPVVTANPGYSIPNISLR